MKGKEINKRDLEKYHNKIVWVDFDCTDITLDGDDESYEYEVEMLEDEYPNRLFILDWDNRMIKYTPEEDEIPICLTHNLIYKFYEWDDEK